MPFGIPNDDFYSNADEIQRRLDANAEAIKRLKAGLSAQGNTCPKHGIYLNWLENCRSCEQENILASAYSQARESFDFQLEPEKFLFARHGRWPNLTPEDKEFLRKCGISSNA